MSETVIKVENLSKSYLIGHQSQERYTSLRDVLTSGAKNFGKRLLHPFKNAQSGLVTGDETEEFFALKDVSFEIKRGDRVGIIGRNGAGKSTLLKILSRITEPTSGRIEIEGRVASLLEVGTGFHPELTGRENIFLNGAILGMTKVEIKSKFDEIVDFAEIEKFLDTPVKRYSSGMYVRLAFAVAAHLEPEILVVDEVLAVGDSSFQKKCLGKMEEVSSEGRTVLFVSHSMQAIRALCSRGIVLADGSAVADTDTESAIVSYNQQSRSVDFGPKVAVNNERLRRGTGNARFTAIEVVDSEGQVNCSFARGETIRFVLKYKTYEAVPNLVASVALRSDKTRDIVTSARHVVVDHNVPEGYEGDVIIEFSDRNLRPREYPLYFWLGSKDFRAYDVVDDVIDPLLITTDLDETILGYFPSEVPGYFDVNSKIIKV